MYDNAMLEAAAKQAGEGESPVLSIIERGQQIFLLVLYRAIVGVDLHSVGKQKLA